MAEAEFDDKLFDLSRPEVVLLVRYVAARQVLETLRPYFWGKYALVLIGVVIAAGLKWSGQMGWDAATFVVVFFLFLALIHHMLERIVTRTILRLGASHRLAGLDDIYDELFDWRTQLRNSLRRFGSPWKLLRAAARDEDAYLKDGVLVLDWRTAIPLDRLYDARAILARGAGTGTSA
jgi:hypothetical protein